MLGAETCFGREHDKIAAKTVVKASAYTAPFSSHFSPTLEVIFLSTPFNKAKLFLSLTVATSKMGRNLLLLKK